MENWKNRAVSFDQAIELLKSGDRVFVHGASATPTPLLEALSRRKNIEGLTLYHMHIDGHIPFAEQDEHRKNLSVSMFTGPALRKPISNGWADFMPIFLSDIPGLFRSGTIKLNAALVQLSPPDRHGYCSLGTSVDSARSAVDTADIIIAEINEQMPRTHGNTFVRLADIDAFTLSNRPILENKPHPQTEVDSAIGEIIAGLVEDRSTLQMGVGAIPDAALSRLRDKKDLGVHSEMFSDRLIDLVECGAVTNRYKNSYPGVIVTSFVMGTKRVFDFVNDNPMVQFHPCDRTNDTVLIRKNNKVVAINSALQIDLTGQVCADSLGHYIYSGIGGQMDFIRGAALSHGGKPIIALPATAKKGQISRITHELAPGAGVVTTRGHVHWVVTEYGAVNLHGKSLRQRAEALISIAHPDFRGELASQFKQIRHYDLGS
jgi:4-hydroxybutyrate CoA-transferase